MMVPQQIVLDESWELLIEPDGQIWLTSVHPDGRHSLPIGCLNCAGIESIESLQQGINVIRSGG